MAKYTINREIKNQQATTQVLNKNTYSQLRAYDFDSSTKPHIDSNTILHKRKGILINLELGLTSLGSLYVASENMAIYTSSREITNSQETTQSLNKNTCSY